MSDTFDTLLAEDDLGGAVRALIAMHAGPERDTAFAATTAHFSSRVTVQPVRIEDLVLLRIAAPPGAADDWDGVLQMAGYRLEEHGMPTLHRSADPYSGDPVEWVLVLCPAADEAAWRAVIAGSVVTREKIGAGILLFDLVAGTGHGRALLRGPDGEWQDWWWAE